MASHGVHQAGLSGSWTRHRWSFVGLLSMALPAFGAQAADRDESVAGDLSGDRMVPTRWVLDLESTESIPGSNVLTGTTGRIAGVVDRDYLHVVVPSGFEWVALRVGNQTTVGGGGSFIGLAAGPVMPVVPDAADSSGLLGFRV